MDLVLTIVFLGCAILAVAGAVAAALAPARSWRLLGLLGVAAGAAGLLLSLGSGLAAAVALVSLGGAAILVAGDDLAPVRAERVGGQLRASLTGADRAVQLGLAGAVVLLAVLLVIAIGGAFASGPGGGSSVASAGRALFGRDAIAVEAVGASLLVALSAGAAAWGRRP